jgi:hypothetical protein
LELEVEGTHGCTSLGKGRRKFEQFGGGNRSEASGMVLTSIVNKNSKKCGELTKAAISHDNESKSRSPGVDVGPERKIEEPQVR